MPQDVSLTNALIYCHNWPKREKTKFCTIEAFFSNFVRMCYFSWENTNLVTFFRENFEYT